MYTSSKSNLLELNSKIIKCIECKRLVEFRKKIAKDKKKCIKMKHIGVSQLLVLG